MIRRLMKRCAASPDVDGRLGMDFLMAYDAATIGLGRMFVRPGECLER